MFPPTEPFHWHHEISISKIVRHHFQLELLPHYKVGLLSLNVVSLAMKCQKQGW
jgi:hypothetical protein